MKIDFTLNGQYLTKDKEIAVFYFSVWPCYIFLMNDSSEWCLSHFPFSSCTASSDNSQHAFPLCFPKIVMLGLDLDLFQFTYCVLQMKKLEQRLNELIDVIQLLNARVLLLSHVWLFATLGTCSLPDSSVHGIFQARILEWVAISSSRRSSPPRDQTRVSWVSCTDRWIHSRD